MYLQHVIDNDPKLIEKAIEFHQDGRIPANTWVINLDTIVDNARALSSEAKSLGLTTYLMSKQHNRNPYINALAIANGLYKVVAVDVQGVLLNWRYGIPIGHVGHLNQIPRSMVSKVLEINPEVFTVYNIEHARWIDHAAAKLGKVQDILIRVTDNEDLFFDGQEGGFVESEIPALIDSFSKLENVSLVGVTSFPCLSYNETKEETIEVTPNMFTLIRAAEQLEENGIEVKQINAPGNTSCMEMQMLKEHGATHIEPGNALLGTTPSNAFRNNLPERTAFVYLTEVSHFFRKNAYAYGGGVYHTAYSDHIEGLVGKTWNEANNNRMEYLHNIKQDIDYHMQLKPKKGQHCKIGDSVVFAYRTQMHMTRSYIAPISGLSGKREIKLHYLFDNANTALDENYNPVDPVKVREDIEMLIETYE